MKPPLKANRKKIRLTRLHCLAEPLQDHDDLLELRSPSLLPGGRGDRQAVQLCL